MSHSLAPAAVGSCTGCSEAAATAGGHVANAARTAGLGELIGIHAVDGPTGQIAIHLALPGLPAGITARQGDP